MTVVSLEENLEQPPLSFLCECDVGCGSFYELAGRCGPPICYVERVQGGSVLPIAVVKYDSALSFAVWGEQGCGPSCSVVM